MNTIAKGGTRVLLIVRIESSRRCQRIGPEIAGQSTIYGTMDFPRTSAIQW
jgi:hypothetical protein